MAGWHLEAELARGLQGLSVVFVAAAVVWFRACAETRVFKGFQTAPFLAGDYTISEQKTQYGKMKKLFSFPSLACRLKR